MKGKTWSRLFCIGISILLSFVSIGASLSEQLIESDSDQISADHYCLETHKNKDISGIDSFRDLAIVNALDRDVSILIGDGTGDFGNRMDYALSNYSDSVAVADFNNDGYDDFVVTTYPDRHVSVFLADGVGGFSTRSDYTVKGMRPYNVLATDLDSDGHEDIVVSGGQFTFVVLYNKGNGTFQNRRFYGPGNLFGIKYKIHHMIAGDFNYDGHQDLAVTYSKDNSFWILREHYITIVPGKGNRSFAMRPKLLTGFGYVPDIAAGDFNGDGYDDLAVTNTVDRDVSIYYSNGSLGFENRTDFPVSFNPYDILPGDYNNDGAIDLAVTIRASGNIEILFGDGRGDFVEHTRFYMPGNRFITDDFNNDGNLDFASTYHTGYPEYRGSLHIVLGDGTGQFTPSKVISIGKKALGIYSGEFGEPETLPNNDEFNESPFEFSSELEYKKQFPICSQESSKKGAELSYIPKITLDQWEEINAPIGNDDSILDVSEIHQTLDSDDSIIFLPSESRNQKSKSNPMPNDQNAQTLDLVVGHYWGDDLSIILGNGADGMRNREDIATGTWPAALAHGDFNNDHLDDVIVVNQYDYEVKVLTSIEDGGFIHHQGYSVGKKAADVQVGDFNNDLNLDAIVVNELNDDVSLLLGDGLGGFYNRTDYPVGDGPVRATLGDYNQDGFLDFAVVNFYEPEKDVSVYVSDGMGGFNNRTDINLPNDYNRDIVTGDFNNDHYLDLLVINQAVYTYVLLGDGTGNFSRVIPSKPGRRVLTKVVVGHFNKDANLDIAIGVNEGLMSGSDYWVCIAFGDGKGSFQNPLDIFLEFSPQYLATADFNEDDALDLAVTCSWYTNTVHIILGDGNGSFSNPVDYFVGNKPYSIIAGDFNNDSIIDLVVGNNRDNDISVLHGNGGGGFLSPTIFDPDISNSENIYNTVSADFDHDQILDIAIATHYGVTVFFGDGNGSYGNKTIYGRGVIYPHGIIAEDFDFDGSVDLAITDLYEENVRILWNNGDGEFIIDSEAYIVGGYPIDLVTGDFNTDGFRDFAVSNWATSTISLLLSDNSDDRMFSKSIPVADQPAGITLGDYNNDNFIDLAVASYIEDCVEVFFGDGEDDFIDTIKIDVDWFPMSILSDDFNNDGILDIATTLRGRHNQGLEILISDGLGNFTPYPYFFSQEGCSIASGDLNADGYVDVAITDRDDCNIHLLYGNSMGMLTDHEISPSGWHPWTVMMSNIDGRMPAAPTISGPKSGVPGNRYEYNFSAIDPEGDELWYYIEWGSGDISGWIGPFPSGETVSISHSWNVSCDDMVLRVKVKDVYGSESLWGVYPISMTSLPPTKPEITGPEEVVVGELGSFTIVSSDPDGELVWYYIDWDDEHIEEWIGPYNSGEEVFVSHTWTYPGSYRIRVKAKDAFGAKSDQSGHPVDITNEAPAKPKISGPHLGRARKEHTFIFEGADPEGHDLMMYIQWGDGTTSGWIGPYHSGEPIELNHTWDSMGAYTISAFTKDIYDAGGRQANHSITILPSLSSSYHQRVPAGYSKLT